MRAPEPTQSVPQPAVKHYKGGPVRVLTPEEIAAANAALLPTSVRNAARTLSSLPRDTTSCIGGLEAWRNAWEGVLKRKGASHAVTFAYNQKITLAGARERFGKFLQHLDRKLLGPAYCRKAGAQRTFAVAYPENISSNLHLHAVFAVAPEHQEAFLAAADGIWEKLVPAGDLKIEPIYDLAGAVAYMTKYASYREVYENLILSSEFHS